MKVTIKLILCIMTLISFASYAWALQIVYPKEGEVFYAGAEFDVVVKAAPGEEWMGVIYGIYSMEYNSLSKEYKSIVKIPADVTGYQEIVVSAIDTSGKEIELKKKVLVKLPPNVVLKSITVDPALITLEYLPPEGDPIERERWSARDDLRVFGIYSDGVKRALTSSASGTSFTSSDEKIATVNSGGKVTAQGIGRTKIDVQNGQQKAEVKVIVKPYRNKR